MTGRMRRIVTIALIVALLLVVGRGVVGFLADRWWAAAISPEAGASMRRWQWLGILLDAGAITIASGWFAMHALMVARSIATVQLQHQVGGVAVRELVPTRLLILSAVGAGVLLGVLTGVGAGASRDAVALAWHGVQYGVTDPVLGVDLGVYVAQLPAWELAHEFAIMLVGLGVAFVLVLYASIGAFRFTGRRLDIHAYARRHIGITIGMAGVVLAWGYLLVPYHLAIEQARWLGTTALDTRIVAAHAVVGVTLAVSLLTLRWAFIGRHTLLFAGWGVLLASVAVERTIIPAFVAGEVGVPGQTGYARDLAGRLYGIVRMSPRVAGDADRDGANVHDRWDRDALLRQMRGLGAAPLLATPAVGHPASWQVVSRRGQTPSAIEVSRFAADSVAPDGAAARVGPATMIGGVRISPTTTGWTIVTTGVRAGGGARRAALAWARQAPGMLALDDTMAVDWSLDPVERIAALVPTVRWLLTGFTTHSGEPAWVLSGFATVSGVPYATRSRFGEEPVDGVVPAIVASIGARTGTVEAWLDPAADSLGRAIGNIHRPLVQMDRPAPGEILDALGYPLEWFEAQLAALQATTGGQRLLDDGGPLAANAFVSSDGPAVQALLEDPAPGGSVTGLTGMRVAGSPRVALERIDPALPTAVGAVSAAWRSSAGFTQVYDSLRASGDSMIAGPLRWAMTGGRLIVWRTFGSTGRRDPARLLWTGVASEQGIEGGRPGAVHWESDGDSTRALTTTPQFVELGRLEAARSWLMRADSALGRGDLTAFGRAWESLRGILRDSIHE